jgi:CRP-like cAMP-binding protein
VSPTPDSTTPRWPRWRGAPNNAQEVRDREKLFEEGQRDFKFLVVSSGKVEIVEESGEMSVAIQGPGECTGDVAQLTGIQRWPMGMKSAKDMSEALLIRCASCGATNRLRQNKRHGLQPVCGQCKTPLPVSQSVTVTDATFAAEVECFASAGSARPVGAVVRAVPYARSDDG